MRAARALVPLLVALAVLAATASPAAAYSGSKRISNGTYTYCIHPDFTSSQETLIVNAVEQLDGIANNLTLNGHVNATYLQWQNCRLRFSIGSVTQFNSLNNNVVLNTSALRWDTSSSTNLCLNNGGCKGYAYAAVRHEVGHWLGFGHNSGSCSAGYWSNQTASACNAGGETIMYSNAADGYWRTLDQDMINGINAWYG